MRNATSATLVLVGTGLWASAASAQVSIGPNGIRSGDTVIDNRGVHTRNAEVTASGVRTRRLGGAQGGIGIVTNGNRRSVDCRGGALSIDGNRNRVQAANCRAVTVAGNDNVVTVSFAGRGALSVPGNRNQVRYRAAPRGAVAVSNLGNRNAVSRLP